MTKQQRIKTESPFEERIGFSRSVRIGQFVAISGTAPIGDDGEIVGVGDAYEQTRRCIEIIRKTLEQAGARLENVTRTRVMLANIEDWEEVARAHRETFKNIRPASTFVQVVGFINPEWLVEIEIDAIIPD
jgi:enamine deaminase RidA (YjgF/YER057c/UK114 family)